MPNHTHGILIINNTDFVDDVDVNALQCYISSGKKDKNQKMSKISQKARTISTIIRSYKLVFTNHTRFFEDCLGWQTGF